MTPLLLSFQDAAAYIGITPKQLVQVVETGRITPLQTKTAHAFKRSDLEDFVWHLTQEQFQHLQEKP